MAFWDIFGRRDPPRRVKVFAVLANSLPERARESFREFR